MTEKEEINWATIIHISALFGLFVPPGIGGLYFFGPLLCWLMKRNKSAFVDQHGKMAINFQLTVLMVIAVCSVIMKTFNIKPEYFMIFMVLIGVANFFIIISAMFSSIKKNPSKYPPHIKFIPDRG